MLARPVVGEVLAIILTGDEEMVMGKATVVNGQAANDGMWGAGFKPGHLGGWWSFSRQK